MTKRNLIGLVVLCSVMLAAGACGKKKGDKAGGGKMGAAGLIGTWQLDGKKCVAANEMFNKGSEADKAKMVEMMNKGKFTVTKETITMEGLGPKDTNKYKVLEDKGKTVVIESVEKSGKKEKVTIKFLSANEIEMSSEEKGKKMVFIATRK